jgi:AraC-like DNA-binding protein
MPYPKTAKDDTGAAHRLRILQPPQLEGLELWLAEPSQQAVERLWLEEYVFSVGTAGAARTTYQGSHTVLSAPAFQVYQPGEVLTSRPLGKSFSFRSLLIRPDALERWLGQESGYTSPVFPTAIPNDAQLGRALSRQLWQVSDAFCQPTTTLEQQTALLSFLSFAVGQLSREPSTLPRVYAERSAVRATMDYLYAFAEQDIAFHELEAVAHLSPYHLIRVFKQAVGITPAHFQLQTKVRLAKERLAAGEAIAQVAAAVGFADQAHLTRTFKRFLGITPGQFVSDNRKNLQDT